MELKKTPISIQNPKERINNCDEVVLGYDEEKALLEANRCLNCINHPCVDGCPINNKIPEFINEIKNKNYEEAYRIISNNSCFPSICSRVCSYNTQCESNCSMSKMGDAIFIGALERFVTDYHNQIEIKNKKQNGHKVAIIGSGPSGLACAKKLSLFGYEVTVYESKNVIGGILAYGIPEYRLPKAVIEKEVKTLKELGTKFVLNTSVGKDILIKDLQKEYEAIYIAIGTGVSKMMNIPGENLKNVYHANDFLYNFNLNKQSLFEEINNKKVVVVGGGNVAIDVARSAVRLKASDVEIIYRRSIDEMPANKEELLEAEQEGVKLTILTNPVEILDNENKKGVVNTMKCIKMELGDPDSKGRRTPIEIKGSEYYMDTDVIVMAISSFAEQDIVNTTNGLVSNKWGYIEVDDNNKTTIDGIYAGGDYVTGPKTVVHAMKTGQDVAESIDKYIQNMYK